MNELNVSPLTLVVAAISRYLTTYLRNAKWFGVVKPEDKLKVHAMNGVVASVLTLGVLFFTGDLQQLDVQTVVSAIFNAVMSFSGATAWYELENSSKKIVVE